MATNLGGFAAEVCAQPYVGVRETGGLYTSHTPVCSAELEPRATERVSIRLDLPRERCRRGCVVHALALRGDDTPDSSAIVGLARALQANAPAAGRDQPSVRECDAVITAWSGDPEFSPYWAFLHTNPDEVRVFCIGLSRSIFECLREAHDAAQADACSPASASLRGP